ncbi:MAG TPA: cytidine deaminase [Algoriphagus sp.]|jgi:cytidine deaminase|uniref:cytidine deaminase n=1 Tax=unclassified Algoriphagus TaxID=2641541 RepID=UPI000C639780|nr:MULTISPECIES: cytidine deaminase [unclassified Algoriphagus]MAL13299.1 cytidine deaminase [Algoriphagus sp.]MAN88771.1 cytidine deaminase [Algoriphagus sp.]QYH40092.1 cytidine deaminase [Algoriphagus sp. NBT04N3]HAS57975.1 cytidine deaminase [Algoriphagus sp.]HAZ26377.1 cytidine deaminase [Algoriphagus sp.]|tara:strand:+ start:288 stop:767 length:480 start_codon:yes stop_codon:yes gene_type:complete
MQKIEVKSYLEILDFSDLDPQEQALVEKAKAISQAAYAPYSSFRVGAAVLLENGNMLQCSNQENVSFPAGVCAEQLVLGYAGANYPQSAPIMMAVVAQRAGEDQWAVVSPCGICRQTINEVENRFNQAIKMLFLRADGKIYRIDGVENLLPLKFNDLKG